MREMIDSGIEWVGMIPSTWDTISNKYIMRKQKRICSTWNGEDVLSLTVNGVIVRDLENLTGKMPATFDGYQYAYENELLIYCMAENAWGKCLAECAGEVSAYPWQFDPYRLQQRIGRQTFRCETERIRRC